MFEKCDYLLPDYFGYIAGSSSPEEHPECLLREGHEGMHLIRFSDGRMIEWQPETGACDCTPQEQIDGECTCFFYQVVSLEEAAKRLKKEGPS